MCLLGFIFRNSSPNLGRVMKAEGVTSTEYFIVGGKNLGAGEFILLDGNTEVVLQAGDEIRVQNSGTQTVTYIATVEFMPEMTVQFQF